jgi:hypothetical protein
MDELISTVAYYTGDYMVGISFFIVVKILIQDVLCKNT